MNDETAATDTEGTTITIQGLKFEAPHRYSEGHVLLANEARQLQQTFREALRNNFASQIKAELKAAGAEKVEDLSEESKAKLTAAFDAYAASFAFAQRNPGTRTVSDPVDREFRRLAKPIIEQALAKKGAKWSDVADADKEKIFATVKERRPEIWKTAEDRVATAKSIASESLDF